MTPRRVVILGAGNVATHLALALASDCCVEQVWSRTEDNARALAAKLPGCSVIASPAEAVRDADVYLISVADDAVATVAQQLGPVSGVVAHTSGSIPVQVLSDAGHAQTGVFYPLQTFTRDVPLNMAQVPFFIEGPDELWDMAQLIGDRVYRADSARRAALHLAAVFACNFANLQWTVASQLLANDGLDFDVLAPLLTETLRKAIHNGPERSQTGPARRGDENVMAAHQAKLQGDELELYRLCSKMINKRYQ